ncbi:MAG TPA: polysaccharide biosynthesis protein, partial [Leptospiraceae bacterium]|nr:polysaccharide biosynthesis protein [Leptospiraceae bacterium]
MIHFQVQSGRNCMNALSFRVRIVGVTILIFQEQIRKGGPVVVTSPDMVRYFMTIPEAAQLVLQAASMGNGGEIFVLDMGDPVKIADLARD